MKLYYCRPTPATAAYLGVFKSFTSVHEVPSQDSVLPVYPAGGARSYLQKLIQLVDDPAPPV